jgi:hypothetical protein
MSEVIYSLGFVLIYEALSICNKSLGGSRLDRPFNPKLLSLTYGAAIMALVAVIGYGFLTFSWWLPISLFLVIAPLISTLGLRSFRFSAFVVQALIFLIVGCAAAFSSLVIGDG